MFLDLLFQYPPASSTPSLRGVQAMLSGSSCQLSCFIFVSKRIIHLSPNLPIPLKLEFLIEAHLPLQFPIKFQDQPQNIHEQACPSYLPSFSMEHLDISFLLVWGHSWLPLR